MTEIYRLLMPLEFSAAYHDFYSELKLYESTTRALVFVMFSGQFKVFDGDYHALRDSSGSYFNSEANIWYHIKITFDCASNTFHVWINGKQAYIGSNPNLQFENSV
ncbi:MAG: hypothetical protein GF329_05850, partial [Candidatus Lokiarchaeota archaeon]|nr:hypothetical protein [Candidatus Lokiarchaeota archaeon]